MARSRCFAGNDRLALEYFAAYISAYLFLSHVRASLRYKSRRSGGKRLVEQLSDDADGGLAPMFSNRDRSIDDSRKKRVICIDIGDCVHR